MGAEGGDRAVMLSAVLYVSYLLPEQFVATEKPFATSSLAIPMPMSPIDKMPTVASLEEAIVRVLLQSLRLIS